MIFVMGMVCVFTILLVALICAFDFVYEKKWMEKKWGQNLLYLLLFVVVVSVCLWMLYDVITIALRGQYMMGVFC